MSTITVRRDILKPTSQVLYTYTWGDAPQAAVSKALLDGKTADLSRWGEFLTVGPWWCKIVKEDETTLWIEQVPDAGQEDG
jgi:hypothetical protein